MTDRTMLLSRAAVPWRLVLAAALLSLLLGVGLARSLAAEHASSVQSLATAAPPRERLSGLPLTAQGPVSATLGAADPAYRIHATNGGLQALNPSQRLSVSFQRSRVLLSSGAARLVLSVRDIGTGASLQSVGESAPQLQGARVVYAHAGLSEWYANGPLGLEQGFTVARAPAERIAGPLTITMALSGNEHATLSAGGQSVIFSSGGSSLRYGDLAVSDARGRPLHSWLAVEGNVLLLRVDTSGARYPLRIDPLVQQAKLTGAGEQGSGLFGYSVALSEDGSTALVGAPDDGGNIGAVWVFTRTGLIWTQQAELTGGEDLGENNEQCADETKEELEGCGFGRSVALSADGNTALIGGPRANNANGDARVFIREGSSWSEQATLTGVEETSEGRFGKSVALSANGNTALISAPVGRGAAWLFTRTGSTWNEDQKLMGAAQESGEGHFGTSVALSGDGATALVGAPTDTGGTEKEALGAAWVFTRAEGAQPEWSQQGPKLTGAAQESGEGRFGFSVALSNDGATALVGARADNNHAGAAWVFTRSEGAEPEWSQQGPKLTAAAGEEAAFGYSVALSGDGNTALIGGPHQPGSIGMAWVFRRSGAEWSEDEQLTATDENGKGRFGSSVALSANGEKALVGGPSDSNSVGGAWVFGAGPGVENVSPNLGLPIGGATVRITGVDFGEASAVEFGTTPAESFTVESPTTITAVAPEGMGAVDVTVTTPEGTSPTGEGDRFTYISAPHIEGISPAAGPTTGNTTVTITGSGFQEPISEVTSVKFGSVSAESFTINSNTSITAVSPPGTGRVGVEVIAAAGSFTTKGERRFNYLVVPPEVKSTSTGEGSTATAAGGALGFGPVGGPACGMSLRSKLVTVESHGRAEVKLLSPIACSGKLTLKLKVRVKAKGGKTRFEAKTIGTVGFSLVAGRAKVLLLKLNSVGRVQFAAHHGRMSAKLVILNVSPAPARTVSAIVHLTLQKVHPVKKALTK